MAVQKRIAYAALIIVGVVLLLNLSALNQAHKETDEFVRERHSLRKLLKTDTASITISEVRAVLTAKSYKLAEEVEVNECSTIYIFDKIWRHRLLQMDRYKVLLYCNEDGIVRSWSFGLDKEFTPL